MVLPTPGAIVASKSTDDFMAAVHSLSPSSKQAISIPIDAGLPDKIEGSMAALAVEITAQETFLSVQCDATLSEWSVGLGFTQFSANKIQLTLDWQKKLEQNTSSLTQYSLTVSAHLQFGKIPVEVALSVGSQKDTILQASISNPSSIDLGVITDTTLEFHPNSGGSGDSSMAFSSLLPTGIVDFSFTSGFLQFNMTQKLCLVFGSVKDLGSCLLIAGKLENQSRYGYAVTFSISSMSSLLPPLNDIEDILTVKHVNASVVNMDNVDIASLVAAVKAAQPYIHQLSLPFTSLPLQSGGKLENTTIVNGTSLYSELNFGASPPSSLLSNLVSVQHDNTVPADVILYAQVKKDSTDSLFLAYIPSLTLFGLLNFTNIEFEYVYSKTATVSLTGDMSVPAFSSLPAFHGSLQIGDKTADFTLIGEESDQPQKLVEPLGMFGVSILQPKLLLHFEFDPFSSQYVLSGSVNFYPSSIGNSNKPPVKPSLTLTAKCIFVNGTPKVTDLTLLTPSKPLTVNDFVATVFNTSWDLQYLNIGFYSGRLYCANIAKGTTVTDPTDDFVYQSGYRMSCKTFIFTEDFQFNIDMSVPLDKTGFSITGSTVKSLDFGIFKISTGETDSSGNYLDKGPSLSYTYQTSATSLSLEAGFSFLDVTGPKATIMYLPQTSDFQCTISYPQDFLGVGNPSITFVWSKARGFRITNWSLNNPSLPGVDEEMANQISSFLAKPTQKGCDGIAGLVFDKTVMTSWNITLSTADRSSWNTDDFYAFQLGGTYEISIAGAVAITSVDLPDIVVHMPKATSPLTMAGVAEQEGFN